MLGTALELNQRLCVDWHPEGGLDEESNLGGGARMPLPDENPVVDQFRSGW